MIAPRLELGTFCVLDRCDNHYTMRSYIYKRKIIKLIFSLRNKKIKNVKSLERFRGYFPKELKSSFDGQN